MALNTLFPRQKELVNYDYFDIAEGVGYVVYFGAKGDDGEYIVSTTSQIYSEEICSYIENQTVSGTATKYFNFDFDLTFNRPKNIKGVISVNVPEGVAATTDNIQKTIEYYCVVKVYHYDGSSETLLATGQSKTISGNIKDSTKAVDSTILLMKCDVTTQTHFKKGETLRFTVEGWFKMATGTGTTHIIMGHDPKNRVWQSGARGGAVNTRNILANEPPAGGTIIYQNTQMIFHVPFVLDI